MRPFRRSGSFERDLKRLARRGYDLQRLAAVLAAIQRGERLPPAMRPHLLKGEWKGYWECHIGPDWLLIYKVTSDEVLLARTGTHADLFQN
jgi:mRNA interferase YafQ